MKNKIQMLLVGFMCLFSTACSSVYHLGIETFKPSEITFPRSVATVVVVDNALPQPSNFGVEVTFRNKRIDTCTLRTDSAIYYASHALASTIQDSKYFKDVLLYKEAVRTGGRFYSDVQLRSEQVDSICKRTQADGVISIDRLLFNTTKRIALQEADYQAGILNIEVSGIVRVYLPGQAKSLAMLHVSDTISCWVEGYLNGEEEVLSPDEDVLRLGVIEVMSRMHNRFVPYWVPEERFFYNGVNTKWREATVYARNEKWDKAAERWNYIFAKSARSNSAKAKAAFNLALHYELKNDFEQALEWANQSCALFQKQYENKVDKQPENIKRVKLYIEILLKRISDERTLGVQLGKNNS